MEQQRQRGMQQPQRQANPQPQQQRPQHRCLQSHRLPAPCRLRDKPGGGHAQEAKGPVEEIEQQRPHRQRPQLGGTAVVADYRGIDHPQQRHRRPGQDDRHRLAGNLGAGKQ